MTYLNGCSRLCTPCLAPWCSSLGFGSGRSEACRTSAYSTDPPSHKASEDGFRLRQDYGGRGCGERLAGRRRTVRGDSPYGNIEFAPFARVPVAREWAYDRSVSEYGDDRIPVIMCDGRPYLDFPLWLNSGMEDETRWMGICSWRSEEAFLENVARAG